MENKPIDFSNELNESLDQRKRKFENSAILRGVSSAIQLWGGIASNQSALIIEAAEEAGDCGFFWAASIEAKEKKIEVIQKARKIAKTCALGAVIFSTLDTSGDVIKDRNVFLQASEGLKYSPQYEAALGALAINSVVYLLNRKGRKSDNASDKFAWRDALKDSVIPAMVLSLAAVKAPHLAGDCFELSGVVYGWYNVKKLFRGWKIKTS